MAIRQRRVVVVTRPKQLPAGMGQAIITSLEQDPEAPAKATEASKDVWSTITDTIKTALPGAAAVAVSAAQARYAGALARATNTVAGTSAVTPSTYTAPSKPWYVSPWVLVGGFLTIGAVAYVAMKSRHGGRRR
jgi:hypothetical protein